MTTRRAPPRLPENNDGSSYLYISLVRPYPCVSLKCTTRVHPRKSAAQLLPACTARLYARPSHACVTRHLRSRRIWIFGSVPCEFLSVSKEVDTYPARTASTT